MDVSMKQRVKNCIDEMRKVEKRKKGGGNKKRRKGEKRTRR